MGRHFNPLTRFFHELFNPHCEKCEEERLEDNCKSCEILKDLLNQSQRERLRIFEEYVRVVGPEERIESETRPALPQPINNFVPWHKKRQELERKDKEIAEKLMREKTKELNTEPLVTQDISEKIQNLEKEVLDAAQ